MPSLTQQRKTVMNKEIKTFFDTWSIYDHVLEKNYMFHNEIYRDVQRLLADRYAQYPAIPAENEIHR